jgi:integrase-like protein
MHGNDVRSRAVRGRIADCVSTSVPRTRRAVAAMATPGGSTICATVAFPGRSKADNAVVESFFRTLKSDLDHVVWTSRHEAAAAIGHYIDAYYNPRRLHSTLGDRSPAQFEREHRAAA